MKTKCLILVCQVIELVIIWLFPDQSELKTSRITGQPKTTEEINECEKSYRKTEGYRDKKDTETERQTERHKPKKTEEINECVVCHKVLSSRGNLKSHMISVHDQVSKVIWETDRKTKRQKDKKTKIQKDKKTKRQKDKKTKRLKD